MRKIIVHCLTGFAGSDDWQALSVDDHASDAQISKIAWEMAIDNAADFGIEPDDGELSEEEAEASGVELSWNIEGSWEDFDPNKHNDHRAGGGTFEDDFDED